MKDKASGTESKCIICGNLYEGYGHNPSPVIGGRCCDSCHIKVVIPARLRRLSNGGESHA